MRYRTGIYCGLLGLGTFWGADAQAQCQQCYEYYTPARYTNGAAGDVALNTASNPPTSGQQFLQPLVGSVGGTYLHAKLLYDSTGSMFTETFPSGTPPSSDTTGEPHECSRPLSPFFLQRLSPGAGTYYEDAQPGVLVKNFGTPGCTVPADGYHIKSFVNIPTQECTQSCTSWGCDQYDNYGDCLDWGCWAYQTNCYTEATNGMTGGSCEKELVDYCNVPVSNVLTTQGGDLTSYGSTAAWYGINALFGDAFDGCMQIIGGEWPPFGIGCGGTGQTTACERAAWQVVNEVMFLAYPFNYQQPYTYWAGPISDDGYAYMDGWSDFNVMGPPPSPWGPFPPPNYNNWWSGEMLGGGKQNGQFATNDNPLGPICAGACDDGGCNNFPVWCSEYVPSSWTANLPDNIQAAATRLNPQNSSDQPGYTVGAAIQPGYYTETCQNVSCCNNYGECY